MVRGGFVAGLGAWVMFAGVAAGEEPITPAVAPLPTISLEAVAVNDIPIPAGPTRTLKLAIGDVVTCKIFVRDWSPAGEPLRAYQVQLDEASYASGDQGVVQPVDFQMNPDKDPNAFIDRDDPQWVHKGLQAIAMVDTVSAGYRFLSVAEDPKSAPVSEMDGKKFVCGTVRMVASKNAKGTYKLGVVEDPYASSIITPDNENVVPIEYEKLVVEVASTTQWRKMLASDPPTGAVDARRMKKSNDSTGAWDRLTLQFSSDTSDLAPADLTIDDGTSSPPKIRKITSEGTKALVELDRGIRGGAWTTFTHKSSKASTRVGCFPGDVNADGKAGSADVDLLIQALNRSDTLPLYRTDVDGDGKLGAGDLLGLLDVLASGPTRRSASGPK